MNIDFNQPYVIIICNLILNGILVAVYAYFSERAKLTAQAELIGTVTREVELAREEFTSKLEQLKTELFLASNVHLNLISEERNSVIEYNDKYSKWLHILVDTSLGNNDSKDNISLDRHLDRITTLYEEFQNSETKFKIFVDDKELIDTSNELSIMPLKSISGIIPSYVVKLKHSNAIYEIQKSNGSLVEQAARHKAYVDENIALKKEAMDLLSPLMPPIFLLQHKFLKQSRRFLYAQIKK